ncbi:MAG: autotransporter-associated beta strand repeat-containing protein [Planctomycetia bacterium]|nr:autotransporter-associated beta strand repeat-containing protein [Planctomycetia bacterium]
MALAHGPPLLGRSDGSGSVVWNNTTNAGDIAKFGGGTSGTAGTVTITGTVTPTGLSFVNPSSGNYTLTGGVIALQTAAPTITASSNGTPIVSSRLVTDAGSNLTISGSSASILNLSLGGSNSIGGSVTVSGSNLLAGVNGANTLLGATQITVGNANTLRFWNPYSISAATSFDINGFGVGNRGPLSFYASGTATISGSIRLSGNASIVTRSAGLTLAGNISDYETARELTLVCDSLSTTTTLSGSNSFTGGLKFTPTSTAGATSKLVAGSDYAFGSGPLTLTPTALSGSTFLIVDLNGKAIAVTGLNGGNTNHFIESGSGFATLSVNNTGSGTFAGVIRNGAGSVTLTKGGAATLTLSAANTYSGATTISAGTLALGASGSFDLSPTITVGNAGSTGAVLNLTAKTGGFSFGSGQTLKGIGTIQMAAGKVLTINGTLAAGNSPGTLTISGGDLVLGASSITSYEINGTDAAVGSGINDLTRVAGSLTLGGTLNVIASPAFDTFGSRTYRIFDYATGGSGSLSGTGSMAIGTTPNADFLYSLTNTATTVNLFVQRKADIGTVTASATAQIITGGSAAITYSVANTTPTGGATLSFASVSGSNVSGASAGTATADSTSGTVAGLFFTGATVGNQTGLFTVSDPNAITTTGTGSVSVAVLDHATPAFLGFSGTTLSINFGSIDPSSGLQTFSYSLTNLAALAGANLTAGLDLTDWTADGDGFSSGLSSLLDLAASSTAGYQFTFTPNGQGTFSKNFTLSFSDNQNLSGATQRRDLTIAASVIVVPEPGTIVAAGIGIALAGWSLSRRRRQSLADFLPGSQEQ